MIIKQMIWFELSAQPLYIRNYDSKMLNYTELQNVI